MGEGGGGEGEGGGGEKEGEGKGEREGERERERERGRGERGYKGYLLVSWCHPLTFCSAMLFLSASFSVLSFSSHSSFCCLCESNSSFNSYENV